MYMANKINVKLILELLQTQMSQRQIEETRHISSKSITAVCRRAAELGVSYADLADKSDDEVYLLFFPDKFQKETVYAPINYEYVHGELICYTDRAVDKHPKIWYNRTNQTRKGKSNEVQQRIQRRSVKAFR